LYSARKRVRSRPTLLVSLAANSGCAGPTQRAENVPLHALTYDGVHVCPVTRRARA
jgi:hypothetical protein